MRYDTNPVLLHYPSGIEDYYLNIFTTEGISDFFDVDSSSSTSSLSSVSSVGNSSSGTEPPHNPKPGDSTTVFFEETDPIFANEEGGLVW